MTEGDGSGGGRVLVIDDEAGLRAAYIRILTAAGFEVESCGSAEEVIERLRRGERYSVIVTDLVMPGMEGTELLPVVRNFDSDVPVVILTGRPSLRSTIAAVEHQAFRYLIKPVTPQVLSATVRAARATQELAVLKRRALEICESDGWRTDSESLADRFDSALRQLFMVYQPIVRASGATFGFEALVRTLEPAFRGPDQLFAAAERLGRVRELGRMIRTRVSTDLESAPAGCALFVNLHACDLTDSDLFWSESALSKHAARIVLEITERKSLDGVPDLRQRLSELRALGYRIAIDDLGAGYAGLSCFSVLEPDIVKLDMSLVRDIDTLPRKRALVESMVRVCQQDLGMLVVCEGVETAAEQEVLLDLDVSLLQGYLFARPQRGFCTATSEPRSEERLIASSELGLNDSAKSA